MVTFLEEQVFLKFGTPQKLISDNHQPLVGRNMIQLMNKYHIEHQPIAAYHAQANPAERYIKTISAAIRAKLIDRRTDHRTWDEEITIIERALNTIINQTTKKTPFFINFGREAILTGNEYETIQNEASRAWMTNSQLQQRF